MLNDLIVIDRYHCETVEAVVVSYPNADACITRLYLQAFAEWSVINHEQPTDNPATISRESIVRCLQLDFF
jgi:hypothetical protein